jgi:riboflavin synthase
VFTGIVAETGKVISLYPDKLIVGADRIMTGLGLGNSVSVNGACLTVITFTSNSFTVGLSNETLTRTNIGQLHAGEPVNLERPLGLGGELGGHLVQGHVDGTGTVSDIISSGGSTIFKFIAPSSIIRYIVEKGFIAVDGISLTVTERGTSYFKVSVVDYSKAMTNMNYRKIGDSVNLEVDIMAKYAEQFIIFQRDKLSEEYLRENGF